MEDRKQGPSYLWVGIKFLFAVALIGSGVSHWVRGNAEEDGVEITHRRLTEASSIPSYMQSLMDELKERKKLFEESEVIKYWFEYTGPLQVSFNGPRISTEDFPGICSLRMSADIREASLWMERTIPEKVHSSSEVQSHSLLDELYSNVRNSIGSNHQASSHSP